MSTKELIKEIQKLPVSDRILLMEQTLRSIREKQAKKQMKRAAEALLEDYNTDSELTAFTDIDFENFYEAR